MKRLHDIFIEKTDFITRVDQQQSRMFEAIEEYIKQAGNEEDNEIQNYIDQRLKPLEELFGVAIEEDNELEPNPGYLKPCPFCGGKPKLPNGIGTQYEIECDCGHACSSVQISDYMTQEERQVDPFEQHRYKQEYINRAKDAAVVRWNNRVEIKT